MAKAKADSEPKLVYLVDRNGVEYGSNSPAEINRLHYGQGYEFRDHANWQEAIDALGDDAAHMPVPTHAAPVPVPDETPSE